MPYQSVAQQHYFHAAEARGDISPKVVHEFDEATKGHYGKLPMHKHKALAAIRAKHAAADRSTEE